MQELTAYEIDTHNIVVNQLLFPKPGEWSRTVLVGLGIDPTYQNKIKKLKKKLNCTPTESNCEHCRVRHSMQQKYLREAHELYDEFFHIIQLPLLTEEVRGPQKLKEFSNMLIQPFKPAA